MKKFSFLIAVIVLTLFSCKKDLRVKYYKVTDTASGDSIGRFYVHETEDEQVRLEFNLKSFESDTNYIARIRGGSKSAPTDTLFEVGDMRTTGTLLKFEKVWDKKYDEVLSLNASVFIYGPFPFLEQQKSGLNIGVNE